MEELKYIIEDKTIAELLGVQNFTNDESAILELVKNAYDAKSNSVILTFDGSKLTITDDGKGMNSDDIKKHWMHVGKSEKGYEIIDENDDKRVLAGSKGVGRFALARLGNLITIFSKREGFPGVVWKTDWSKSTIEEVNLEGKGTIIVIENLRENWTKNKVIKLISFLSKTYNDNSMTIDIVHPEISKTVLPYFTKWECGLNCLSHICLAYDSEKCLLNIQITSDEFLNEAEKYCSNIDLNTKNEICKVIESLKGDSEIDLSEEQLKQYLIQIGDFGADLAYYSKPSKADAEKFLYKHLSLSDPKESGIVLYRNAFSISSYEGKKDWLVLGKRSRKSPAAATHPTGSWRVRENQLSGKVEIDKLKNVVLQDLSNRQGLDENIYYELFVKIIHLGIKEFERYRQSIIRLINVKNIIDKEAKPSPVSDKIIANPKSVVELSKSEVKQLVSEIKNYKEESDSAKKEVVDVENRYKYDVRVLNVLATVGLKASSIAHEMRNDRNTIATNIQYVIDALKEYGMWDELTSPEKTTKSYKNIPHLLDSNKAVSTKILAFMNVMLSEIEKKQFDSHWQSISDALTKIIHNWSRDYAWVKFCLNMEEDICFSFAEDVLQVIFDNLILNSIQQNESKNHLVIEINVRAFGEMVMFEYFDNGKGLDEKYLDNPRKILEVHETNRKKGHGLGMWIIHNTCVMSGGGIEEIKGDNGFFISFTLGGKI